MDSILNTIKKILNLPSDFTAFDTDVITATNTAISTITQLGVGPEAGFEITSDTETWDDLLGSDPRLNAVKNYVSLKARLIFDPPSTSFGIGAIERQLDEMAWRIEVAANPAPPIIVDDELDPPSGDPGFIITDNGNSFTITYDEP